MLISVRPACLLRTHAHVLFVSPLVPVLFSQSAAWEREREMKRHQQEVRQQEERLVREGQEVRYVVALLFSLHFFSPVFGYGPGWSCGRCDSSWPFFIKRYHSGNMGRVTTPSERSKRGTIKSMYCTQ